MAQILNGTLPQIVGQVQLVMGVTTSGTSIDTFGAGGGGTITGGTSLGNATPVFAGVSGPNLTFNSISGTGSVTVTSAAGVITVSGSDQVGTGDVVGPAVASGNAIALYNGTTGKLIKNSDLIVQGSNISSLSGPISISGNFVDITSSVTFPDNFIALHNDQTSVSAEGALTITSTANSITANAADQVNLLGPSGVSITAIAGPSSLSGQTVTVSSSIGDVTIASVDDTNITALNGDVVITSTAGLVFPATVTLNAAGIDNQTKGGLYNVLADNVNISSSGSASNPNGRIFMEAFDSFNSSIILTSYQNTTSDYSELLLAQYGELRLTANSGVTIASNTNVRPAGANTNAVGIPSHPFASGTFNNYLTTRVSGAVTSASTVVDWSLGASQIRTWTNGQPSGTAFVFSGANAGSSYVLETVNNASGTALITWPATVKWQNFLSGTATASGNSNDLFTFYYNGSNFFGNAGNNYR